MTLAEAADVLLDAAPLPVDDWELMKNELLSPIDAGPKSASG